MPIEFDDQSLRIIGNGVKALRFYDDARELQQEIYLQTDNTLNIGDTSESGGDGGMVAHASRHESGGSDTVNHDSLTGFIADEHVAHSGVTLTAGSGLTGGGTIAASRSFAVGAGDGIDVSADAIAVDVTDFIGHGISESSNNIQVDEAEDFSWTGVHTFAEETFFDNNVTLDTNKYLYLRDTGIYMRSPADGTLAITADSTVNISAAEVSIGDIDGISSDIALEISNSGEMFTFAGGDITMDGGNAFQTTSGYLNFLCHVYPNSTDTYDLGSSTNLWRKGYLSELETVIFAEETITISGARQVWGHNQGTLAANVSTVTTTVDFGQTMTPDDFVEFRGYLQFEYMKVGSLVSGTTYNVTRDLDGSGANAWVSGTPYLVLGNAGDARVEIDAGGPYFRIMEQGTTYNADDEYVRIGNMTGVFGTGANDYWGLGVGDYAGGNYLRFDSTNGFEMKVGGGKVYLDEDGFSAYNAGGDQTVAIETDGDAFFGSDISAPATTAIAVFATAQTYNSQSFGAGDVLIGDNSSGSASLIWDASDGDFILRLNKAAGGYDNKIRYDSSSDRMIIGTAAANETNLHFYNGGLDIRLNTTNRISMTSAGVFTINDSGGDAVFTFDASAGAEITKVLEMPGTDSAIAIGVTPPTSASAGTGIWLDRTGLYTLDSGTVQVKMDATDGVWYAADEAVQFDEDGITINTSGDADNFLALHNSSITTYTSHHGGFNLQATDPNSNTYGILNMGLWHDTNNASVVSCWLNEVDFVIQKSGSWRYVLEANYDYVNLNAPLILPSLSSAPTTGVVNGMMYYDSSIPNVRARIGGAWQNLY